eukprot:CAMPEP_0119535090 /NCGR_PEP_ID=MMETSP1344-20130328/48195_1 /TAXON_ID=236787 /ORGANISM="Florenciella parvula, Strain CCMP2471" /LENGTH=87 /DNA_ID=CAMNT_0007576567 /DNA_START=115 /DNA_END=378 /DNA_ORIENTATION=-
MSHAQRSATFPTSIVPCVSCIPIAFAALRVTPSNASSGESLNSVHAMLMLRSSEPHGEEPGLEFEPSAIGTPNSLNFSTGGFLTSLM